jgi:(hydroxyamino)benzene mutase
MNRNLVRLGFILFFLSLVTGLISPNLKSPRLGLSAHLVAVMSGTILTVLGLIYNSLKLGAAAKSIMFWSWTAATYGNWLATFLSAIWGTSGLTPIAGAGSSGTQIQEGAVLILLIIVSFASFAGVILTIYGLRGKDRENQSL